MRNECALDLIKGSHVGRPSSADTFAKIFDGGALHDAEWKGSSLRGGSRDKREVSELSALH
jgi:hypothetical protein